jgi:hypothetical protein
MAARFIEFNDDQLLIAPFALRSRCSLGVG